MLNKSLYRQALVAGLLLVGGCDVASNAERDFNRVVHSSFSTATPAYSPARTSVVARPAPTKPDAKPQEEAKGETPPPTATPAPSPSENVTLMGKSEGQVRALLGAPTSVEERAPGKTWHYRDGQCSVDVQMYPDVKTRQFGTLAYEVKSDDNSDEGKRGCLARFRSRAQPGSG